VKVKTTRFGEIDVDDTKIIEMRRELLGFEGLKTFTIISQEDKGPFMWLQSLEDGSVAFVVVNPQVIKPDYEPEISDADAESLKLAASKDVLMLAIVTIRMDPFRVTANLRAPVVINKSLKIARQIVLEDEDYSIKYNLSENDKSPEKEAQQVKEKESKATINIR
jgi:Uncharacterized protein conserved in bacteria